MSRMEGLPHQNMLESELTPRKTQHQRSEHSQRNT